MGKNIDNINIETTQNIDIQYQMAGVGDRIIAQIIDLFILITYIYALVIGVLLNYTLNSLIIFALYIPILFYSFLCETFLNGQTFGKKIRKIKVVKLDGTRPSIVDFFTRWLLEIFEIKLTGGFVALITIIMTENSQRLGDLLAKTTVIKLDKKIDISSTIFTEIDENYKIVYEESKHLTEKDIELIRELIGRNFNKEIPDNIIDATYRLKDIYCRKLKIETTKSPLEFLNILLKDYNYLRGKV